MDELTEAIIRFRDERDWKQFHHPKDLAVMLSLEAGEVLEHFRWMEPTEQWEAVEKKRKEIGDELADVLFWILLMSHDLKIDILKASHKKLAENKKKYPIDKVKGKHHKYTEYK